MVSWVLVHHQVGRWIIQHQGPHCLPVSVGLALPIPSLLPFSVLPGAMDQQGQHLPHTRFSLSSEVWAGRSTEGFCVKFQWVLMLLGCSQCSQGDHWRQSGQSVCARRACSVPGLSCPTTRSLSRQRGWLLCYNWEAEFIGSWMVLLTLHVKHLSNLWDKRCCINVASGASSIGLTLLP